MLEDLNENKGARMFQSYEDFESPREARKHRPLQRAVSGKPLKGKTHTVVRREFIYCSFFLITDHVCEELFLIPRAAVCLYVDCYSAWGRGRGASTTNRLSIWIRILLMAFSFPSVSRTSLTSAEIATWKEGKKKKKKQGKQWANMLVCVEVRTAVTSLRYHDSSPISL